MTTTWIPDGATATEWFDTDSSPWRWIRGQLHTVTEGRGEWRSGEVSVQAESCQYPDGQLLGPGDAYADPPGVVVHIRTDDRLTPDQARRLAAALCESADEVEGWVSR